MDEPDGIMPQNMNLLSRFLDPHGVVCGNVQEAEMTVYDESGEYFFKSSILWALDLIMRYNELPPCCASTHPRGWPGLLWRKRCPIDLAEITVKAYILRCDGPPSTQMGSFRAI